MLFMLSLSLELIVTLSDFCTPRFKKPLYAKLLYIYGALDLFWNQILGNAGQMLTVVCRFFSEHSRGSVDPAIGFIVSMALVKV